MRRWRSSAAYRIAFVNFGAYATGLAVLGVVVFAAMHVAFSRQLNSMVRENARILQNEYTSGGERELAEAIAVREKSRLPTRMLYGVFTPDGRRIYGSLAIERPPLGNRSIVFEDPKEGPDAARAMTIDLAPDRRLVVAVDSDWLEKVERLMIAIFTIAFLGSVFVGFGGAVILGSYLQRRIQSISNSAEAIIRGDIRRRMPVGTRRDEFDQLAATLNRMLDRIEGLLNNLRQVSGDIAHDLRTPLARLRNRLEQSAQETRGDDLLIADAIHQLDEVLSLFAAILRVAEVESGETKQFFAAVDISALLTEVAESYALAFEDQGRAFLWSIEPGLTVEGDRELLAQAVVNLLENAQRHTPDDAVVRLTVSSSGNSVNLQVMDNGPGVPKADLGRITKRFARLESSRNTAGHGLGLSLVSAVAKLHGGQLILRNCSPGLSAVIEIPQIRAPAVDSDSRSGMTTEEMEAG
ncbi:MAG TPA: HAMP domain-containing sensor histidine kinase [Sphingomicrobium sp.]|nr:HAMP domain-containing sensor histidine kinase [Sphingomicrobium sp.]